MNRQVDWLGVVGLVCTMGFAGSALAQSTWDLSTSTCDPTGSGTSTTAGCTVGGISATVEGWSTSTTSSDSLLQRATLTDQGSSGIGMTSSGETSGSPNHAIDSSGQDELVLINFGTDKVSLSQFWTGWSYNDTDISLLRWDGGTSGPDLTTMSLTGSNPDTALTSSGWSMVRSADLDGTSSNSNATFGGKNSGALSNMGSSSWWIITAYYGDYGGTTSGSLDKNNDYFKLLKFAGACTSNIYGGACGTLDNPNPNNPVPEPASLALVAVALLGAGYSRRRQQRRS